MGRNTVCEGSVILFIYTIEVNDMEQTVVEDPLGWCLWLVSSLNLMLGLLWELIAIRAVAICRGQNNLLADTNLENVRVFIRVLYCDVQSNLVISKSMWLSEILRDVRTSTFQI